MRFNQITEDDFLSTKQHAINGAKLAKWIKDDCQPYLSTGATLFRGQNFYKDKIFDTSDALRCKVSSNRSSVDSSSELVSYLNSMYQMAGSPVRRNNCIFCSRSQHSTASYGDTFIIFPIDEFDAIWHNDILDAYTQFESSPIDSLEYYSLDPDDMHLVDERVVKKLEGTELNKDSPAYKEMWDTYYRQEHQVVLATYGDLDFDKMASKFVKGFQTDLRSSDVVAEVEVMVKCDQYYAVRPFFFEKYVKEHL